MGFSFSDIAFLGATSTGPVFNLDTTGLTMWYKGYDGVLLSGSAATDGGTVDQVVNQNSTTDALQTSSGARPTWHANANAGGNRGVIRFDGTDDFLSVADGADSDLLHPITFFYAIKIPVRTSFTMLFTRGNGQQYETYIQPNAALNPGRISYCAATCRESGTVDENVWTRVIVRLDTDSNRTFFYVNGVDVSSLTPSAPSQTHVSTTTFIGKRSDGLTNAFDMLECGAFNRNMTGAEITALDTYLAAVVG